MMRGRKFTLDRANGKVMGVCAGMAEMTGWDVTLIRVALVVTTLFAFPWTAIIYLVAALIGKPKGSSLYDGLDGLRAPARRTSAGDLRGSMTDLDRRLAEVETFVASPNQSLAREIDALR
jgi:phage shock protein C